MALSKFLNKLQLILFGGKIKFHAAQLLTIAALIDTYKAQEHIYISCQPIIDNTEQVSLNSHYKLLLKTQKDSEIYFTIIDEQGKSYLIKK